jgi:hypothetical protein
MTDDHQVTHNELRDRLDYLTTHSEKIQDKIFDKIESVIDKQTNTQAHFNRWFFFLCGSLATIVSLVLASISATHDSLRKTGIENTTRIAVLEKVEVPPPEVKLRFQQLEDDARNRERQLDEHIKRPRHGIHD